MIKKFFVAAACLLMTSCIVPDVLVKVQQPVTNPYPVDFTAKKNGNVTDLNMVSEFPAYFVFAVDNQQKTLTVDVSGNKFRMGRYVAASPIYSVNSKRNEDGGLHAVFRLGAASSMTYQQIPSGVKISLTPLEADTDISSMDRFGGWADPSLKARNLIATSQSGSRYTLSFDGVPVYSAASGDGRNWVDIFGVEIGQGALRDDSVSKVESMKDRTRIYLSGGQPICISDNNLTIGEKCAGFTSFYDFTHNIDNSVEYFTFKTTGKPDITFSNAEKMSALGVKGVKFFGDGVRTFPGSLVYKMEFREKKGYTWLVFLHEPGVKFKQSYDDGRLTVVFYK